MEEAMHEKKMQVKCPVCGYKMPVFYDKNAASHGLLIACKGRNCKTVFEIKIRKGQQVK